MYFILFDIFLFTFKIFSAIEEIEEHSIHSLSQESVFFIYLFENLCVLAF